MGRLMMVALLLLGVVSGLSSYTPLGMPSAMCPRRAALLSMSASMFESGDDSVDEANDLNWLHTKLQIALDREDYAEAAQLRDRVRRSVSGVGIANEAAWKDLGVPDWLADRLEALNFPPEGGPG